MKYYAGIGSRETPENINIMITDISKKLDSLGYILRSGGAQGADSAFEDGSSNKEIYLPWKGFNNNKSDLYLDNMDKDEVARAYEVACKYYHSDLNKKKQSVKNLMTRNIFQILGKNNGINLSEFVICWTKDGLDSGGTGQALRLARSLDITVFNLYSTLDVIYLNSYIRTLIDE